MNEVRNKPNDKFSPFRSENCRIIINLQKPFQGSFTKEMNQKVM